MDTVSPHQTSGSPFRIISFVSWIAFHIAALLIAPHAHGATSWTLRAEPTWRTIVALPETKPALEPAAPNGSRYLLSDHQVRVREHAVESYWHWARVITNEAGLQSNSQVSIEFDATYQRLILHSIVVRRDSEVLNRLAPDAVKIIQRERDLDANVYDGRNSAVVFLNDLRVGDVVEYAYTLDGADPTLEGRYADAITLGAPESMDRLYARLVVPHGRHLDVSLRGPSGDPALLPRTQTVGADDEYSWDLSKTKAYPADTDSPSWYDLYPWAQVSDYESWEQVAAWGTRLFRVTSNTRLHDWVQKTLRESGSSDEFLLKTGAPWGTNRRR